MKPRKFVTMLFMLRHRLFMTTVWPSLRQLGTKLRLRIIKKSRSVVLVLVKVWIIFLVFIRLTGCCFKGVCNGRS